MTVLDIQRTKNKSESHEIPIKVPCSYEALGPKISSDETKYIFNI